MKDFAIDAQINTFLYPETATPAIKEIHLKIRPGEYVGIVGASGSGKTTLLMCLCGAIPHAIEGVLDGKIFINGLDTTKSSLTELSQHVGMLMQDPENQLFNLTVEEDVAFGAQNLGLPRDELLRRLEEMLAKVRLTEQRKRSSWEISGGQKQAAALAAVLIMNPSILLLDEPTSELDPVGSQQIFEIIAELNKKHGATVVVVDHKIEELAKYADRMLLIDKGTIKLDAPTRKFFNEIDVLTEAGTWPPIVSVIAHHLEKVGVSFNPRPLTLEEGIASFKPLIGRKKPLPIKTRNLYDNHNNGKTLLEIENLWHIYPNGVEALRGVNLQITRGEIVAIIGQNGSGKTTLAKHLNGLLRPTRGVVKVNGINIASHRVAELARQVGYVFQNPDHQLFKDSLVDEVGFGPRNMGWSIEKINQSVKESLRSVDLDFPGAESVHPYGLSKGQRQRLAVAAILSMQPELIVVDEPTTGQDRRQSAQIMDILESYNQKGHTIIVITHDMELVLRYAKRVVVMSNGQILADDSPEDIFSKTHVLKEASITPPQIVDLNLRLNTPTLFRNPEDFLTYLGYRPIISQQLNAKNNIINEYPMDIQD